MRGWAACAARHFNPRSPHGERPEPPAAARAASNFNPRSPHGERPFRGTARRCSAQFQSTLPARGATRASQPPPEPPAISIHAPRTGSDDGRRRTSAAAKDFNPRSPHGERRRCGFHRLSFRQFQSTLPARGATIIPACSPSVTIISIHAPRTGSDSAGRCPALIRQGFQSTLPARGATSVPGDTTCP